MPDAPLPILLYDGRCGFCRIWIEYWKKLTGDSIEYAASQDRGAEFPQIPRERFANSVQFVRPNGSVASGARAVFESLSGARPFWFKLYDSSRVFTAISEFCYRIVARNRSFFYYVTKLTFGTNIEPLSFALVQWIFLRALALIYAIAFGSLATQITGLVGSRGILPAPEFLDQASKALGGSAFWAAPSIFWIGAADGALQGCCWAGVLLALFLMLGIARGTPERIGFGILWVLYLSFSSIGQDFLSFQWDALLLEAGFLALFLGQTRIVIWLFRWLVFRLFFLSGAVKLLSHDATWRDLTALQYHFHTQPLPNLIAWYADHLPEWFLRWSTVGVFVCELGAPFFVFFPRRMRLFGAWLMIGLQILILLTGNYTFFNILTIALCLFLFDDRSVRWMAPNRIREKLRRAIPSKVERSLVACGAVVILVLSVGRFAETLHGSAPGWLLSPLRAAAPFQIANSYGLFAVMTTSRTEIVMEGSDDGATWSTYEFRYKPGDVKVHPRQVAPFQPRLDWQMWFAALSNYRSSPWFVNFAVRLLEGSPPVLHLLATNPFPNHPPRYIRAMAFDYSFASFADHRATGAWWQRKLLGAYLPPVSLRATH